MNFFEFSAWANDSSLDVYQFRLMMYYHRRGKCWEGTRGIADNIGISRGKLLKVRAELLALGLLRQTTANGRDAIEIDTAGCLKFSSLPDAMRQPETAESGTPHVPPTEITGTPHVPVRYTTSTTLVHPMYQSGTPHVPHKSNKEDKQLRVAIKEEEEEDHPLIPDTAIIDNPTSSSSKAETAVMDDFISAEFQRLAGIASPPHPSSAKGRKWAMGALAIANTANDKAMDQAAVAQLISEIVRADQVQGWSKSCPSQISAKFAQRSAQVADIEAAGDLFAQVLESDMYAEMARLWKGAG